MVAHAKKTLTLSEEQKKKLEAFLNQVADERDEDRDGPGSMPSHNAYKAMDLLKEFGMERKK